MSPYKIYPNPVKDHFIIKPVRPVYESIDLSIFTFEGLLYREYKFRHPDNNYEYIVEVKNLPRGHYYVMIHSEKGNVIERLEKT
jgi:hypothetical protein